MMEAYCGNDQSQFPGIFQQMYKQRYHIYVKRRKWKGLQPKGDLEIDQYDTADATYLLAVDEKENVLAGLRLLKTTGPHIFGDLFPQLSGSHDVPRGENILELTRFYVAPSAGASRDVRKWLIGVLSAGMFEYCLENDIHKISSVIDTFLLPQMLELEWRVRPLGLPYRYGQGSAVGVLIDIDEEGLASTRRIKKLRGPVLHTRERPIARIPAVIKPDVPQPVYMN